MVLTIGAYLNLPLPLKPLVVKTGSMEPTIPAGSLVLVTKKSPDSIGINYVEGDVITFKSGGELVSHRVVSVDRSSGQKLFRVKGDANKTFDSKLVAEKDIVGKVSFSAPHLGRFVDFVKQPLGFLLLIVVPTLLIIISEVIAVWEELKKKPQKSNNLDFAKPFAMFFLAAIFMGSSHAFFSDVATSTNNTFTAAASFPHIVINEVYYDLCTPAITCGNNPQNEWVELYNPTTLAIVLTGWTITDNFGSDTIPSGTTIPANGFLVITPESHTFDIWSEVPVAQQVILGSHIGNGLSDTGDQVILKNASNQIIDAIIFGNNTTQLNPAIGSSGTGHSLERNPDGIDTNTSSDFVNRTTPTPGS